MSFNNKEIDINIENLIYIEFIEEEITLIEQEKIMVLDLVFLYVTRFVIYMIFH